MTAIRTTGRILAALTVGLALVLPASPAAHASTADDIPAGFDMDATAYGSGCKDDAVIERSEDHTWLRAAYPGFIAEVGEGADPRDRLKSCSLTLKVTVPEGMTWAFKGALAYGFTDLAEGVRATHRTTPHFLGTSPTTSIERVIRGPRADDWLANDDFPVGTYVWHPCGLDRDLTILTTVTLQAPKLAPRSLMSVAATEIDAHTDLVFKKCSGATSKRGGDRR